ncbi:hypothetical protein CC79DRAFT_1331360 [Sarocladium strictum]
MAGLGTTTTLTTFTATLRQSCYWRVINASKLGSSKPLPNFDRLTPCLAIIISATAEPWAATAACSTGSAAFHHAGRSVTPSVWCGTVATNDLSQERRLDLIEF